MDQFEHVKDEGVKTYLLSSPSDDLLVVAKQLDAAEEQLCHIRLPNLEKCHRAYDMACCLFGERRPFGVHYYLRVFWGNAK